MLRLFDFGVICYEIKNGRHILVWLATWGGSLPGQLRYGNTSYGDEPMREEGGCKPKELIRGGQGLAEG